MNYKWIYRGIPLSGGGPVEGSLLQESDKKTVKIVTGKGEAVSVIPSSVDQSVGLSDLDGRLIFGRDILQRKLYNGLTEYLTVEFVEFGWSLVAYRDGLPGKGTVVGPATMGVITDCKVVGNMHQPDTWPYEIRASDNMFW